MLTEALQSGELLLLAAMGGFMLNMMNLYEDQQRPKNMRTAKDTLYWILFVFWPLAGGVLVLVYILDGSTLRPLLAFTVGLTAPATLQSMIQRATAPSPEPQDAEEDAV